MAHQQGERDREVLQLDRMEPAKRRDLPGLVRDCLGIEPTPAKDTGVLADELYAGVALQDAFSGKLDELPTGLTVRVLGASRLNEHGRVVEEPGHRSGAW
jgi:hypothetical protein